MTKLMARELAFSACLPPALKPIAKPRRRSQRLECDPRPSKRWSVACKQNGRWQTGGGFTPGPRRRRGPVPGWEGAKVAGRSGRRGAGPARIYLTRVTRVDFFEGPDRMNDFMSPAGS